MAYVLRMARPARLSTLLSASLLAVSVSFAGIGAQAQSCQCKHASAKRTPVQAAANAVLTDSGHRSSAKSARVEHQPCHEAPPSSAECQKCQLGGAATGTNHEDGICECAPPPAGAATVHEATFPAGLLAPWRDAAHLELAVASSAGAISRGVPVRAPPLGLHLLLQSLLV